MNQLFSQKSSSFASHYFHVASVRLQTHRGADFIIQWCKNTKRCNYSHVLTDRPTCSLSCKMQRRAKQSRKLCEHTFPVFLALLSNSLKGKLPAWSSKQWKQCWCDRSVSSTHPLKVISFNPGVRNLKATIILCGRLIYIIISLFGMLVVFFNSHAFFFFLKFFICLSLLSGFLSSILSHSLHIPPSLPGLLTAVSWDCACFDLELRNHS